MCRDDACRVVSKSLKAKVHVWLPRGAVLYGDQSTAAIHLLGDLGRTSE